jgi:AraC-like DNA-binding protein
MNSPLHRFTLFGTSDAEKFDQALRETGIATCSGFADATSFTATGNLAYVRGLALGYGKVSSGVTIDFADKEMIRLQIALSGQSLCRGPNGAIEVSERQLSVTSLARSMQMHCEEQHEWLSLCVAPDALKSKLEAVLGDAVTRDIEFEPATSLDHPDARKLRKQVLALVNHLDADDADWSPLALHELEQSIITTTLVANRHNYTPALEAGARNVENWKVRRLVDYIEANWSRPFSIEKLALETGSDVQSLFRAFKRSRGCTPRAFTTALRLRKAREILLAPGAATTAKEVSVTCGFPQFSQFVSGYLRTFGERPHETLARAAGQILARPLDAERVEKNSGVVVQQATILVGAGIACTVLKISDDGATIEVHRPADLPTEFELRLEGETGERYCAAVWRGRNRVGVIFV